MKLQNKDSGEIGKLLKLRDNDDDLEVMTDNKCYRYKTLAEVAKYWEDYEEPIEFWTINLATLKPFHVIEKDKWRTFSDEHIEKLELVGFKFETEEETEKAIEKLMAWTRMKKCGLRFWGIDTVHLKIGYSFENYTKKDIPQLKKDLDLLFGDEE